jgi:hypothetical protein
MWDGGATNSRASPKSEKSGEDLWEPFVQYSGRPLSTKCGPAIGRETWPKLYRSRAEYDLVTKGARTLFREF